MFNLARTAESSTSSGLISELDNTEHISEARGRSPVSCILTGGLRIERAIPGMRVAALTITVGDTIQPERAGRAGVSAGGTVRQIETGVIQIRKLPGWRVGTENHFLRPGIIINVADSIECHGGI